MTDGPNEAIPEEGVRKPGTSIGLPPLTAREYSGSPTTSPTLYPSNPFLASTRPVPPEVQAVPARTPGFAPRKRAADSGEGPQESTQRIPRVEAAPEMRQPEMQQTQPIPRVRAERPAPSIPQPQPQPMSMPEPQPSGTQMPPVVPTSPGPMWPIPPAQPPSAADVPWPSFAPGAPERPESGRRRGVIIGASAAAAVAVAIGAISLAQGSSSATGSADTHTGFAPGAGDPTTGGARDGGRPLDGSTSRPDGQDVNAGAPNSAASSNAAGNVGPAGSAPGNQSSNPSAPATSAPPPAAAPTSAAPPVPTTTPTPNPPAPRPSTTPPKPSASTSKPNMGCTGWHTTHVVAQDGSGYAATGTFTMRSGPYSACSGTGSFASGQHMYIWCHAINGYGNTWVYGRIDGTNTPAWQSAANFKPGATLGPVC